MGRAVRVVAEGASYHVVARGNNRQTVFLDDDDCAHFMELLAQVAATAGWRGYAYCLMSNHFHLAFMTPVGNLPEGMRDLMGRYARWFNRAHRRSGHAFGGRYRAALIESDEHLLEVVRYVARNPVTAGLIADPALWEWGSYRSLVEARSGTPFVDDAEVLGLFARHRWRARRALRHFVESGPVAVPSSVFAPLNVGAVVRRPSVGQVFSAVAPDVATRACQALGYTHAEIAAGAGVSRSAITHRLRPPGPPVGGL